jgi:hypothetical protein
MANIVVNQQVPVVIKASTVPPVIITINKGEKGDNGEGVPTGGTTGQALLKNSATDYDVDFGDVLLPSNNLSDVANAETARQNLGAISESDALALYLSL